MASAAERAAVASVDADGLQARRGGALQSGNNEEEDEEEIHGVEVRVRVEGRAWRKTNVPYYGCLLGWGGAVVIG